MTKVFWSPQTRLHDGNGAVWVGLPDPGDEVPERIDRILATLSLPEYEHVQAKPHDDAALRAVHDPAFLRHLETIHDDWLKSGIPELAGQDRVVAYAFPTEAMLDGLPGRVPPAIQARAGSYAFDTMTPVGPGTWAAARAAADCALSAVDAVLAGEAAAYALCRPPGHHATTAAYGGSCYLNNAAIAAQALRDAGHERVAIVDVDAHHGNGTASIFYERPDVFYGSVHVDPGAGWFPHFVGYADETGSGPGAGASLNLPLAPESGDRPWLDAIATLADAARRHGSSALVVSLGVDAAADDPNSPLRITFDGYRDAGEILHAIGLPTVIVQEGGYHLDSLGGLVRAFLEPFES
ncbi:MAG TPA: histone deacetylase family protein [Candidatus Limnocylindria bacterium]|nr:histone deacetylase family protein [Candidatus Limnocylindria bacterium]